ncbi:ABC transporter permease subunit [candidate division KSB3 bacterium]|uniref:ABC transporter permease subunit n=1 Tax=candidate division KSB3 bacterium TaxID=2044937 RepID=A0A9D5JXX1_9BACT|nr:ABC transporter permease subunit [candidate division KSB3 bacterium]MBD3325986.1 ABC transporter permease subunit [candidate division KSB3 bacterium]
MKIDAYTAYQSYAKHEKWIKIFFIWPTLLLLLFLIAYPFIMLIYYSFFNFSFLRQMNTRFVGLENYTFILTDDYTWERFIFTFKYVVFAVGVQFFLGMLIAHLLQEKFRGRELVFTIVLMPMMLCPIVVGLFWKYMFNTEWGIINYFLHHLLSFPKIEWLGLEKNSIFAVVIADTWMWTPFMVLLSSAAFSAVPKYLYEAASVDRASAWFKFTRITLPLSAPILILAVLFRLMDCIKQFDLIYTLTGGGPGDATQTVSFALYKTAFQYFYTGEGSAWAFIMLIIIIGLSSILIKLLNYLSEKNK